jgi:hypothetical protein
VTRPDQTRPDQTRQFHLGDILSITTGRLVSPRHVDGVYDILNFMTGDSLFTHQLPRASQECRPHLIRQMPWLDDEQMRKAGDQLTKALSTQGRDKAQHVVTAWLDAQVKKHGQMHAVLPIPHDDHKVIDPIDELRQMGVDDSRIITVNPADLDPKKRNYRLN